jgi:hypothetical protein
MGYALATGENMLAMHYGARVRAADYATPITYPEIEATVHGDFPIGDRRVWRVINLYCAAGSDLWDTVGFAQYELLQHVFDY